MESAVTITNLSYSYDSKRALDNLSFTVMQGSYIAIVGSNGSGKSTLCRLICGLIEKQLGSISIAPGLRVGLVFQSPKDQIVSGKVFRDTAFGPQNLRLTPGEVEMRTIECLSVTELLDKAESPSNSLSLGQTQKLAIAGMLAVVPDILVLDEAVAMLDYESRQGVFELLQNLNESGKTIIHITHDIEAVSKAQSVIGLDHGKLFYEGSTATFLQSKVFVQQVTGEPLAKAVRKTEGTDFADKEVGFSFKDVCFAYEDGKLAARSGEVGDFIKNVSFDLYKGTLTALTGPSGAGKSTLLELGSGLLAPDSGCVYCGEHPALAQQNCSAALFEAFAVDDVAFGPKNNGVSGKELVQTVVNAMNRAGLAYNEYGERNSSALSGGEQKRLAVAGILAMNRDVVFFDEPTAGLDGHSRILVMNMMRSLAEEGKTVLFTTHHQDEADFADREIKILDGKVTGDSLGAAQAASSLPALWVYEAAGMLTGLKNALQSMSGSGWKTKCVLEKLPAGLRMLLFLVLFILSLVFRSFVPCCIMLAASIVYCLLAKFRLGRMIKTGLKILPFLCFFAVFQIMFRPALEGEVCWTTWKFFTVTPSKLWFCLNSILRTYAALFCVSAFFVSTPEYDLIDGLKKIIPSRNLILILEVIFRFIPLLVEESAVIIKTQIIRGGLGKAKGRLARIRAFVPLIVPLIIRTVKRSEILADAIIMRCYNEK